MNTTEKAYSFLVAIYATSPREAEDILTELVGDCDEVSSYVIVPDSGTIEDDEDSVGEGPWDWCYREDSPAHPVASYALTFEGQVQTDHWYSTADEVIREAFMRNAGVQ